MNIQSSLPLVAAPVVVAVLLAAPRLQDREPGLVPVEPGERAMQAQRRLGAVAEAFDPEPWRAALSATDLDRREEAFGRVVRLAQRDPAARDFLQALAEGDERELAWTARLAQRELRNQRPLRWDSRQKLFDPNEMERELESLFEQIAPGFNFRLEPLKSPFAPLPALPPGTRYQGRSVDVQSDSDGWVLRITENKDGGEETREYRGETLEEILEANPELKEEVGIEASLVGPGLRLRIGSPEGDPFDFDAFLGQFGQPFPGWQPPRAPGVSPRGRIWVRPDVLGVLVTRNTAGAGLRVRHVSPGTIAHLLGISAGDVLLELNGVALKVEQDITDVLEQRGPEGEVAAVWLDAGGERKSAAWRPADGDDC